MYVSLKYIHNQIMPYQKSFYLFIYYIVFTVFVCLVFSSLATSFENSGKLEDDLTEQSFQLTVSQEQSPSVTVKEWLDTVRKKDDSFLVMKRDASYVSKEIFLQNYPFRLASDKKSRGYLIKVLSSMKVINKILMKIQVNPLFVLLGRSTQCMQHLITQMIVCA